MNTESVDSISSYVSPKIFLLGAAGAVSAGTAGYLLETVIAGVANLTPLLLTVLIFFAVLFLQVLFIENRRTVYAVTLIDSFGMITPFLGKLSFSLLAAWLALAGFWLLAARRGREELDNQLKVKFFRIERYVLPYAFNAFALFISILVVWVNGATLTKERFLQLIQPAQPIIQGLLSQNFTFNMSIAKFAELSLESRLGAGLSALPQKMKTIAVEQALNQLKEKYGFKFNFNDSFNDVIYNYIVSWLEKIPEPVRLILPISAALLVFLTLVLGLSFF